MRKYVRNATKQQILPIVVGKYDWDPEMRIIKGSRTFELVN